MRLRKAALVTCASIAALTGSGLAEARGGHWGGHWGGFGWGFGLAGAAVTLPYLAARSFYYPYYGVPAYYPYYGYAPNYAYGAYAPARYVERASLESGGYGPAPVRQEPHSYFYCRSANGYYPYIRQCSGGWERIPARPAGA